MAPGSVRGKTTAAPMSNTPYSALPVHPSRLIKKGYQVSRPSSVLEIEVALKIVSDMVGVAARKRGAYGADHLLGCLCVQTRYVFLQCGLCKAHLAAEWAGEGVLSLACCQCGFASKIKVAVSPGQYALHWVRRRVPWC